MRENEREKDAIWRITETKERRLSGLSEMENNQTPLKKPTWRERLHALKTAVRRRMVIGRHNLNQKRQVGANASMRWLRAQPAYRRLGRMLYDLGFQAEYLVVRTGRSIRNGFYWLLAMSIRAWDWLREQMRKMGHALWKEVLEAPAVFVRGVWRIALNTIQVARTEGISCAAQLCWKNLCHGVQLYSNLLPRTMAYVVPVLVGLLCWNFLQGQLHRDYALSVQVKGQDVGYVSSERVFESAKESVNERIRYVSTDRTGWDIVPTYTMSVVKPGHEVLNENTMADAILRTSSDEIQTGTALYIDGELSRITTDGKRLEDYLEELKKPYATDDPLVQVGFNHEVELVDGIYFTDSFTPINEVMEYLTSDEMKQQMYTLVAGDSVSLIASKNGLTQAELYALNPGLTATTKIYPGDQVVVQKQEKVLEIRVHKQVTYTEPIPFMTNQKKSNEYNFGVKKTLVEGQEGEREVTAMQTFDAAGNLLTTEILSTQVLREPVNKEVVIGTRMASGSVGKVGSGTLMWPVPNYRRVSRWVQYRSNGSIKHKGVDIAAPTGTAIYAADSGVVEKAGWNRDGAGNGYGLSIIINHGNGVKTLYAHCSAKYVNAGQSVSQGQHIANVGNTGRSYGSHLHFEIHQNGRIVPPQNVFSGK